MPKNTLFNYFSPKTTNKKAETFSVKSSAKNQGSDKKVTKEAASPVAFSTPKRKNESHKENIRVEMEVDGNEEDLESNVSMICPNEKVVGVSPISKRPRKKRKIVIESDDEDCDESEDDYKPVKDEESDESILSEGSSSNPPTPSSSPEIKRKKTSLLNNSLCSAASTSKISKSTLSKLNSFHFDTAEKLNDTSIKSVVSYFHESLNFLKPEFIKDLKGRSSDHEDYDSTTLFVPLKFLNEQTPGMHQWWKLKSNNFDVILFFKVGKFYELYHMDAMIGVKELGLIFMRGAFAHCGFPEVAFGRYSDALVKKGYVVARVEQTEKPAENKKRVVGLPKFERTLRREICQISAIGTQQLLSFDGAKVSQQNEFLLAVIEGDSNNQHRQFGVCFVDTMTSEFLLSQFDDDKHCSRLATFLAHYNPCQVLHQRTTSSELRKILENGLSGTLKTPLRSPKQFWEALKTIKFLFDKKYFEKTDESWPGDLKKMLAEDDLLSLTPATHCDLAWRCLGACTFYMKRCLIDHQVLSSGKFMWRDVDSLGHKCSNSHPTKMIIDSVTLANLEILVNSSGSSDSTLISCLDRCQTAFGKRLFRQWVCSPLCLPEDINCRLDAVEGLMSNPPITEFLKKTLNKMIDLEKMLVKIHSLSKGCRPEDHPENRAVFFEEKIYRKQKICDFVTLLDQFEKVYIGLKGLQDHVVKLKSSKLRCLLGIEGSDEDGIFPDILPIIKHWKKAFDHEQAKETGKIAPVPGANQEYDLAINDIKDIEKDLETYLKDQRGLLRCSSVVYKGVGNKRYQIDVPNSVSNKLIPDEYVISAQRKGFRSFRTDMTNQLLKQMEDAEYRRDKAQSETIAIIFREFHKDYIKWNCGVSCLAQLDCFLSLADFADISRGEGPICRPKVLPPTTSPYLILEEARHPSLTKKSLFSGDDFIPNDTYLGGDQARCLLLTGPNMGGKSTLMRQVGLNVILAQIGSYVPAERCEFTVCDRVFTRLGASDRIMSGESTFYVEMNETCSILKHASCNSLILLDELGRGTATYDGTAIASSVLEAVASSDIGSRTIFSTHYHTLVEDFATNANVSLAHMSCMVENEGKTGDDVADEDMERIIFLYKLAEGACPKSYGFHAASLAGLPRVVIDLARKKAEEMEKMSKDIQLFRSLMSCDDPLEINRMFSPNLS